MPYNGYKASHRGNSSLWLYVCLIANHISKWRNISTPILNYLTGLILGLRPANERRRYFVTTSLIGWPQA